VSTGDPTLDRVTFAASCLFLLGMLMVVATAVPVVQRRYPRFLMYGFLLAILSFVVVGVAAVVLG
jgi:hypothetical protein